MSAKALKETNRAFLSYDRQLVGKHFGNPESKAERDELRFHKA